jgi:glycerate kinase
MNSYSILLASDSYKGSASSEEVENYLEKGIQRVLPNARILKYPIADGGEGTIDALVSACHGVKREIEVSGPLGDPVRAFYGILEDGTVIVEMAQASGITLVKQSNENVLHCSTFGVGQIIENALDHGAKKIMVGLGGSATSDGGVGMAKALGVRFLDANGHPIECGLIGLRDLKKIDCSEMDKRFTNTEIVGLTDVSNPLTGKNGAIYVYGPQKGIALDKLAELDGWMKNYAALLKKIKSFDVASIAGTGAAGGLGVALVAFCGAKIVSGIDAVLDAIKLEDSMRNVDLVITGEGRMDGQSVNGKAPVGVARRARQYGVPVIAVVGSCADNIKPVYDEGIDLVLSTINQVETLQECFSRVGIDIPNAGETAIRAFLLGKS